ncbi:hypothetical protein WMF31_22960 [Sorangium sp. So ce1036]|uniref:hypothetical protein n=1 Tax=Sorangium sp. So ce1036 TaxID=3133328 RepID=UPI003F11633B
MRTLLLALLPALPVLSACGDFFGDRDAHAPGTALGTFHVVGTQTANTCGEGALGATRSWEFNVELARDAGVLFWDNGASLVPGVLDEDLLSFSVEARVVVDMRTGDMPPGPPCSVERRDRVRGELGGAGRGLDDDDVTRFEGRLSFDYAPTAGSRCEDLVVSELSVAPVFAALPCTMVYALTATRTALPPE